MARLVAVHGIANQFSGGHQLQRDWRPALQDGLCRAGAAGFEATDLICAGGKGIGLSLVQAALDGLSQSSFFAGLAETALIGNLKQVRRFGPGVVDRLVENGSQAHDAKRYLGSREVGDARCRWTLNRAASLIGTPSPSGSQSRLVAGGGGLHPEGEEQGKSRAARPAGSHLAGGVDPVGELTGADERSRENDLAGEQAMGGGRSEQSE